ncbi:HAMP domain-containing sensor histidine kinase [Mesorhizobium sp. B2-3-15]|uniref:sensor histidine kinase n=1 Tax=Mesorhizobium sp. B2-3-15 TaxID=2589949 RepID=UPI00112DDA0B|nr:HAMP domain-containing sensor histidine kinase [Mesorhizobium sp. B2-3-15]TPL71467.1 HAMP domain-containing histidine kinase [Mesorhizobium sp. B2-3-15]
MKFYNGRLLAVLPYLGMAAALGLSAWTFIQSDRYRQETDAILNQTFEIQWRAAQIRERLIRVYGYLRIADATGKLDADIDRQMALVSVNVAQLENLPYLNRFFPDHDAELLGGVRLTLEQKIAPLVSARKNYTQAIADMTKLEQSIYEISSSTVDHSATLQQTANIDIAASRNWFIFAIALGLGATFYLVIHQRYSSANRRDQHMRSFASLFAHMTRSRVTALRLFLEHAQPDKQPSGEMLDAARGAANELESITNSVLQIAYAPQDSSTVALGQLLEDLTRDRSSFVQVRVDTKARLHPVPAAPFRLVVNELIENALAAFSGARTARVLISATLKRQPFLPRSYLVLEVADKGAGMPPAIVAKATTPFFSTRAGNHTGLGLTACSQMVSTLNGKLVIHSAQGVGTTVQVRIPVRSTAARFWQSSSGAR